MWHTIFLAVGIISVINLLYETLKSPVQLFYYKWLETQNKSVALTEKYGKWAAITGATDGIGKAYAKQLALRGFNVVLVARNLTKLQQVAKEIETQFGVEAFTVQADFSHGPKIYEKLFQDLSDKPIGLLINNVGVAPNGPTAVCNLKSNELWDLININIGAATQLSRHFLDIWYQNGTKGCIVNISSILGLHPCPYASIYGASKAFIRHFSLSLQHEVKPMGIAVQLLEPAMVVTKINSYSSYYMKGNLFVPQVDAYAKWAVNTLGKADVTTGYFWHGIQTTILKLVPYCIRPQLMMFCARLVSDDLSYFITEKSVYQKECAQG